MDDPAIPPLPDSLLRAVPIPAGWHARLKGIADWPDGAIDQELLRVLVPEPLGARCRAIVEETELEWALCAVDVPGDLLRVCQSIPNHVPLVSRRVRTPRGWKLWHEIGLAISTLALVGGLQFFVLWTSIAGLRREREPLREELFSSEPLDLGFGRIPVLELSPADLPQEWISSTKGVSEREWERWEQLEASPWAGGGDYPAEFEGPARRFARRLREGLKLDQVLRPNLIGSEPTHDEKQLDIEVGPAATSRGVLPPVVAAYDRTFLFRHGVHPVTSTRADPKLAVTELPLITNSGSLRRAIYLASQQRSIAPLEVRVEEFLAGVPYGWPEPTGNGLDLRLAASPSPFGEGGALLVQVGVKAGRLVGTANDPIHLVVVLDTSLSMGQERSLDAACAAVVRVLERLSPDDRYSIITFGGECTTLVEGASLAELPALRELMERLRPAGGTNLHAAVDAAIRLAQAVPAELPRRQAVAVLTDEPARFSERLTEQLQLQIRDARAEGVDWKWFYWGSNASDARSLARLANGCGTDCFQATDDDRRQWAIWEFANRRSSEVAHSASLQLRFNVGVVAAYRILGHEAISYGGLLPAAIPSELRVGQESTALFEIWLDPSAVSAKSTLGDEAAVWNEELVSVDLSWTDPRSGDLRVVRSRLRGEQVAARFGESAPSLQLAALLAETAEVLRESSYVPPRSRNLREVQAYAHRIPEPICSSREFRSFVEFLRQAELLRAKRAPQ